MTTPPVRELSHCWAHVHRQQEPTQDQAQDSRPFNWKTASVLDQGREATCSNTQQTASPSILHDEQQPRDPSGRVADHSRPTPSVCARSTGAPQLDASIPSDSQTSWPQQKSPGPGLERWNQPPGAAAVFSDKVK